MDCTKYLPGFPQHGSENQSLETIRALHQTIVSLRTALAKSKSELQELKSKSLTDVETDIFRLTIEKLSLENHVLRQRILVTKNLVKDEENVEVSKSLVNEKKHSNFMDQPPSKAFIQTVSNAENEKLRSDNDESCDLPAKGDCSHPDNKESKSKGTSENFHQETGDDRPKVQRVDSQVEDTVQIEKKDVTEKEASNATVDTEGYFEDDRDDSESEELDDIELIFTTEDTKDLPTAQENLVSITDAESWNPIEGTPVLLRYTEVQQFDEAPEDTRLEGNESKRNHSVKCSVLEKTWENSVLLETDISKCGVLDEKVTSNKSQICQTTNFPSPSHHRPIIYGEKAFLGGMRILPKPALCYDTRPSTIGVPSTQEEAGATRPILVDGHASARRESGAQTDITALPSRWRSEGYLTHKVSHNFTTLPSKFTISPSPLPSPTPHRDEGKRHLPAHHPQGQRLPAERHAHLHLNEESRDARRTLLSDINFTSMVPELSRSADHLCQDGESIKGRNMEGGHCFLMDQRIGKKYDIRKDDSLLLCDLKRGLEGYQLGCHDSNRRGKGSCSARPSTWGCSMCRASITFRQTPTSWSSIPSTPNAQEIEWNADVPRRSQWKKTPSKSPSWAFSVPTSPTNSHPLSYPVSFPHTCAHRPSGPLHYSGAGNCTFVWGYDGARKAGKSKTSVPHSASSTSFSGTLGLHSRKSSDAHHRHKNRVTFKETGICRSSTCPGNSLPDLRDEYRDGLFEEEEYYGWSAGRGRTGNSGSGGDSTDSLIDEAEEFLRHSIDSILTGVDWARVGRRRQTRRHSDPDPVRELRPPHSAQPFLPKEPKDLRAECFTKVILSNGRVAVGRVRYSGILRGSDKEEYIVGVELPCQSGDSDGTYNGIRYFDCDPKRAVFVPFNKVILAWDT